MIEEPEIFKVAAALPAGERPAYLDATCAGRSDVRAEVEELLRSHDVVGFMEAQAAASLRAGEPEKTGERIGQYLLREQIGEGGFGTVWVADQEQPVRRRVALKIIKLGMDTREVIARFEQERQALALMDHPSIAKVFDAGATPVGRPFFVMELVCGKKITEYCDEARLPTADRLHIFIAVCHAVQHAHQKGIIHRDLKPSNILVTRHDGVPVPKVIDFGVAKATEATRLTDLTVFTRLDQMIGTPLYMSPEQAERSGLDIDTRSDIYSLGVLLYELLTGRTPFAPEESTQHGLDEIRRTIREREPPRPSRLVGTLEGGQRIVVAQHRQTDSGKLARELHGDLDWIVMKCLEKDRSRRYDTASALALDLQRHLANETVVARPPTAGYLLGKLIRRNQLAFAAGAAIATSFLIAITVSGWQAMRVKTALEELRATAPAFAEQARGLVARERFDEAIEKLAYAAKLRPAAPEYLLARGDVLQCQFRLAEAATAYRAALQLSPDDHRIKDRATLCEELLAAPLGPDGKLTRESLGRLHLAMQQQQRPAAELMPVARLLGEEKKLLVEYWLARLRDLPISPDNPLEKRLTVREDGLLALDLSETKVADLTPLAGAPLAVLNLAGATGLPSIAGLRGMGLIELNLTRTKVDDLTPLRDMRTLETLRLNFTRVSDLSPLQGLRLKNVDLSSCPVRDISALRGAPLEELFLRETRVTDLAPLAGMPLHLLDLAVAPVLDFQPLAGLPLEVLNFASCQIADLSILRDMPLRELMLWGCAAARNYAILGKIKTLELLILPHMYRELPEEDLAAIAALRHHPALRQLGSQAMSGMDSSTIGAKEVFWQDWDRERAIFAALRKTGFPFSVSQLSAGAYVLSIKSQPLSDLSVLRGLPISHLYLDQCQVADLSPIRELPLRILGLRGNPVADLTPLLGMPLEELSLEETKVSDLSPITTLLLKKLYLHDCPNLTDVSPIEKIPTLERVTVPVKARNIEVLRDLPKLQMLAFGASGKRPDFPATSAVEFWKLWPGLSWMRTLNEAAMDYAATQEVEGTWTVIVRARNFHDCSIFKNSSVRKLSFDRTSVVDLRPLEDLPLTKLTFSWTRVTDLAALRSPALSGSLREVSMQEVQVADFSPLAACTKLEALYAAHTPLADLAVIRGRKLREIDLDGTRVADISALAGMPLRAVHLKDTPIIDLRPLLACPTLKSIALPAGARDVSALRGLPELSDLSYEDANGLPSQSAAEFWATYDARHPADRK